MPAMSQPRGKRIAIGTIIVVVGTLAVAVIALHERLLEEYCLRRIDSADRGTSESAWDRLALVATERAVPRMLALLTDEELSDLTRARALHVLWVMSQEGRSVPLEERPELARDRLKLVTAAVKAVDEKESLALVSAGRDEGVEIGSFFLVRRDLGFVGALRVFKVYADSAGAQMLDEPGQREMLPGDQVIGAVSRRPAPWRNFGVEEAILLEAR